jgi:signal transduction histidine kinase/ligand-binding sensor domain-containing protein
MIPEKDSNVYDVMTREGVKRRPVFPPIVRPADFLANFTNFRHEQGLKVASVDYCFVDKAGNLWFGTLGGGVFKFDGKSWISFTANQGLGSNTVNNITQDSSGNMYFSNVGFTKYDGSTLTTYTTKDGLIANETGGGLQVTKDGIVWIGTRYGVSRFDGRSFTNYTIADGLVSNQIICSLLDRSGNVWFGTDKGVSCFDGRSFKNYTTADGLVNNSIRCIYQDRKGTIWFGGMGGGMSAYDGISFTNYTDTLISRQSIHSILEDRTGNIWLGTFRKGLIRFDGKSFLSFTTKQGLVGDIVNSLVEDRSGNIWAGTSDGVSCYQGGAFISFGRGQGMPDNKVRNITEDKKGNFWFVTHSEGICRYDGKNFTIFSTGQGLPHNRVHRVFEDRSGELWFCTGNGVSKYDGRSFTSYTPAHGLVSASVRCILQDPKGFMWFGTEMGLSRFDNQSFSNYTTAQGLPYNNVRDMVQDEAGNLWLGFSSAGGICRFNEKNIIVLDTAQGLSNIDITSMSMDSKGNILVGTYNGGVSILRKEKADKIERLADLKNNEKLFENFTTAEGLADDVVYDIVEDKEGNIIIGTNLGYTIIRGGIDPVKPVSRENLEYFNWYNGYLLKDLITQAMYVDRTGAIWGGTGDVMVRFDHSAIHKSEQAPLVKIQGIKINNEKLDWNNILLHKKSSKTEKPEDLVNAAVLEEKIVFDKTLVQSERDSLYKKFGDIRFTGITKFDFLPVDLKLPYHHNNVTFDFAAIQPVRSLQVRYQYMLQGYDKNWSPVTEISSASFGNIDEGKYTFKVKAQSPDGIWSEPVTYSFTVLPPWYRTWWAYLLYASLVGFSLYVIYQDRIRRLKKRQALQLETVIATQEQERKRISRDLHDDVGTKLSALKFFLIALKDNAEKKQYPQVDLLVSNSGQLIDETITDVREMLLNLSPGILEDFGFATAVEALVSKINQANVIRIHLTVFGLKRSLKKEYELALYRITQELINNVLKHSAAKNVDLQIGQRDDKVVIMIEDDGVGFDVQKHKEGYGLKNLEARTKLLSGVMNIDSRPGKGTSVFIEVPYKS